MSRSTGHIHGPTGPKFKVDQRVIVADSSSPFDKWSGGVREVLAKQSLSPQRYQIDAVCGGWEQPLRLTFAEGQLAATE